MQHVIEIKNGIARNKTLFQRPINISFDANDCIAVIGPNGAGKSQLIDIITGKIPLISGTITYNFSANISNHVYDNISYVSFLDVYGTPEGHYYYQQRWNQTEIEAYPTISQLLDQSLTCLKNRFSSDHNIDNHNTSYNENTIQPYLNYIYKVFDIKSIENKRNVMLSSGESRRFQLLKALLSRPQVLIIDNPFIGLDSATRNRILTILRKLYEEMHILIIMIFSSPKDIPDFTTDIVEIKNKIVKPKISKDAWMAIKKNAPTKVFDFKNETSLIQMCNCNDKTNSNNNLLNSDNNSLNVVELNNVTIKYGNKCVLNNLSLTIKDNEHWAITGNNGSGKSTLLGIIYADNPQAYANDIVLFGHKRGHGESIWDIKKHIGYISPEIHRSYLRHIAAINVVASGLRDTVGLYLTPKPEDIEKCVFWMKVFGIEHLAHRDFMTLSNGEQRLILLSRAFVKDPKLLLLDEPFHGLDPYNRQLVTEIIYAFCKRNHKTLIMVSHFEDEFPNIIDHRLHLE